MEGSAPPPRCVGIDDWAWRKGRRYGTIVVDLERGRVVDLLPDREEEAARRWLSEHPGVALVSRDRASAYSQAATEAAPAAVQVADRWHLLKNLREAVERLLEREHAAVTAALAPTSPAGPGATEGPGATASPGGLAAPGDRGDTSPAMHRRQVHRSRRGRRVERFGRVRELSRAGQSVRQIAEAVRMSPTTIHRYLRLGSRPDWAHGRVERSRLDEHRDWIDARIADGCINSTRPARSWPSEAAECRPSRCGVTWRSDWQRPGRPGPARMPPGRHRRPRHRRSVSPTTG